MLACSSLLHDFRLRLLVQRVHFWKKRKKCDGTKEEKPEQKGETENLNLQQGIEFS